MMRRAMACAALVLVVGCDKKPKKWIEIRATQIHVGTLEVDIPTGWRDVNELIDKPKMRGNAVPGMRTLFPEDLQRYGDITVFPLPTAVHGERCNEYAELWKAQPGTNITVHKVEGATFAGNPGCLMSIVSYGQSGTVAIVTPHGGSTVAVRCFGYGVRETCLEVAYGLHVTLSP